MSLQIKDMLDHVLAILALQRFVSDILHLILLLDLQRLHAISLRIYQLGSTDSLLPLEHLWLNLIVCGLRALDLIVLLLCLLVVIDLDTH